MTTPVESLAFCPTLGNGTTKRTLGGWVSDQCLNVKDYGAVGDGVTNDTAAIQACLDAAFGTYASPHANPNNTSNRPVYFPPGGYLVRPSISGRSFSAAADNGSGKVRLAVSTTGLTSGDNINVIVSTGDTTVGGTWFVTVIDSGHLDLRNSAFSGTATGTITTPCLRVAQVQGGLIFGAGRFSTTITTDDTNGAAVFMTNRFEYSRVENINFSAKTHGIAFQLDSDGDYSSPSTNLQSNTFYNNYFSGTGLDYGVMIGRGQNMGSENLFLNNYFDQCGVAALSIWNLNALMNTVIGGNISNSDKGIYVNAGSCNVIHGVSFQNNTTVDIHINNGVGDCHSISGCRSESANFCLQGNAQPMHISCCYQTAATSGYFFSGHGYISIDGCSSVNGYITDSCSVLIRSSNFQRSDFLTAGTPRYIDLDVIPQLHTTQTGTSYTLKDSDGSSKIKFTNGGAITVTVPKNSNNAWFLGEGNWIDIQQYGAGQITLSPAAGVTLHSGNGLKTSGQYAVIRLTVDGDGADTYTVSGSTTP